MSDKTKNVPSTSSKSSSSTVGSPSSSHCVPITSNLCCVLGTPTKGTPDTPLRSLRQKINKTPTICDADISMSPEAALPDFDSMEDEEFDKQIAYGKLLRSMLEDCLLDEKIEREEAQIDKDMALLADKFQKTMSELDKYSRRLKDISFVAEQQRLLDLKRQDNAKIFEATDNSNAKDALSDLSATEQANFDNLSLKNVDFGYDKDCGYKQLMDVVNEAIGGLEDIKEHSNLDISKCKEFESTRALLKQTKLSKLGLETLQKEFDVKIPLFSEKLLKEASEKFRKMIKGDNVVVLDKGSHC